MRAQGHGGNGQAANGTRAGSRETMSMLVPWAFQARTAAQCQRGAAAVGRGPSTGKGLPQPHRDQLLHQWHRKPPVDDEAQRLKRLNIP